MTLLNKDGGIAEWPTATALSYEEYKNPVADAARATRDTFVAEVRRLENEQENMQEQSKIDFGPESAFFPLMGKCSELRVNNQYTYSVCPFGAAKQDSTSLGTFSGWKQGENGNDYSTMLFTGGQHCWNGPSRSMTVHFECGLTEAILSVDEPEKCAYSCKFTTPAACDAKYANALRLELEGPEGSNGGHDEL
jgi:protein kinase C substrate 80K-H